MNPLTETVSWAEVLLPPSAATKRRPRWSKAKGRAVSGEGAALPPTEGHEAPTGPRAGEYAAFWQRVDDTRRAIAGFPDRAEAFGRAWGRELSRNPHYPDAEEGGEIWTPYGAVSPSEEPGDRAAGAAGLAGRGPQGRRKSNGQTC